MFAPMVDLSIHRERFLVLLIVCSWFHPERFIVLMVVMVLWFRIFADLLKKTPEEGNTFSGV